MKTAFDRFVYLFTGYVSRRYSLLIQADAARFSSKDFSLRNFIPLGIYSSSLIGLELFHRAADTAPVIGIEQRFKVFFLADVPEFAETKLIE